MKAMNECVNAIYTAQREASKGVVGGWVFGWFVVGDGKGWRNAQGGGGCCRAVQGCSPTNNANVQVKAAKAAALSLCISTSLSLCKLQQTAVWPLFFFNSSHLFPFDPLGGDSNGKGTFLTLALVTRYGWDLSF